MEENSTNRVSSPRLPLKARLMRYYQRYNPSHIPKIDFIIDLYEHDEAALFQDLHARYGPEPVDEGSAPVDDGGPKEEAEGEREGRQSAPIPPIRVSDASPAPASPLQTSMCDSAMEMPDASSPFVRGDRRRFSTDVKSGNGSLSASVVYDDAFSPNRRRAPQTLGTLFATEQTSDGAADGGSAVAVPNGAPQHLPTNGSQRVATPSSTRSDAFVSNASSVVYRRDAEVVSRESARRIVDEARKHANIGFLANTTSLILQRSVAAEAYAHHLETLRDPSLYAQKRGGASPITAASPSRIVPPVRALQSTLNIDEMSSYRALAAQQHHALERSSSMSALLHPSPSTAVSSSSPRAGGLFVPTCDARPLHGKRVTFEGEWNRFDHSSAAEQIRNRLRAMQTSPLVAMQRARMQREAVKSRGYVQFEPNERIDRIVQQQPSEPATTDNDGEPLAVDMICTECGMVCKIIPGHEHEFIHDH